MKSTTSLTVPFYDSICSEEPQRENFDAVGFICFFPGVPSSKTRVIDPSPNCRKLLMLIESDLGSQTISCSSPRVEGLLLLLSLL